MENILFDVEGKLRLIDMSHFERKPVFGVSDLVDTNRAIQL